MLLVIFGAGASYDSSPFHPPPAAPFGPGSTPLPSAEEDRRPPLAKDLFENRTRFVASMNKYPQCRPVIPRLAKRTAEVGVEQVLAKLQEEAAEYPVRWQQLTAIRYYLQDVIWDCQREWCGITQRMTNYLALLDRVDQHIASYGSVCIVTFNYDTMLEEELTAYTGPMNDIAAYVSHQRYKLIKVHGSVTWTRDVEALPDINALQSVEIPDSLIDQAANLHISDKYRAFPQPQCGFLEIEGRRVALYPAIAIPVEAKAAFECPSEHLKVLIECLKQVTRVLVIGWAAQDSHVLQLVAQHCRPDMTWLVVAQDKDTAKSIIEQKLVPTIGGTFRPSSSGFSKLVVGEELPAFLRGRLAVVGA